jgi:hypothetical protein
MTKRAVILQNASGLTLIELCLAILVASTVFVAVINLARTPVPLQKMIMNGDAQAQANRAASQMAAELKQASPQSIDWTQFPSTSSLNFQETRYDMASSSVLPSTQISYVFQPSSNPTRGTLLRIENGVAKEALASVVSPTSDMPLVQQDPVAYHVLILQFAYQPLGASPVTVVQRVALGG